MREEWSDVGKRVTRQRDSKYGRVRMNITANLYHSQLPYVLDVSFYYQVGEAVGGGCMI